MSSSRSKPEQQQPQPPHVLVTLAEIARVAGVGRAAVSNWRRRHDSFPKAVGGTDASPQFNITEVEAWLRERGKFQGTAGPLERLWPRFEALGDRDRMAHAVAEVGARLGGGPGGGTIGGAGGGPSEQLRPDELPLVSAALDLAAGEGARKTFGFLLQRWQAAHVRQIAVTPPELARLMAQLATACHPAPARTVLDPACGIGTLLSAAADAQEGDTRPDAPQGAHPGARSTPGPLQLIGYERTPALAALASAHLTMEDRAAGTPDIDITVTDTLREDPRPHTGGADLILCDPPTNERDWGHGELATDRHWQFGPPPRTESELAWVQQIVSLLAEDGTAVVLLPPAVASRRAGRRIRAELLRSGAIRAVVALPPGAAAPFGVGLHLWVLRRPQFQLPDTVLLVDAGDCYATPTVTRSNAVDWDAVRSRLNSALEHEDTAGPVGRSFLPPRRPALDPARETVPGPREETARQGPSARPPSGVVRARIIELLGETTDLTPARRIPAMDGATSFDLRAGWTHLDSGLQAVRDAARALRSDTETNTSRSEAPVSVADLEQTEALQVTAGQSVPEEILRRGPRPPDGIPVLTLADLRDPDPRESAPSGRSGHGDTARRAQFWIAPADVESAERNRKLTVTDSGDVVVINTIADFDAWVDTSAPIVLGPGLTRMRPDADRLDPWFLAACLRVRSNARRAAAHASSASRVDPRRLDVLRLPLEEQRRRGEVHRLVATFERTLAELTASGAELTEGLTELLASGRLGAAPG